MQLFQYHTGMDCRIGYSHEHVAKTPSDALTSPVFATGVGLVLKGYERMGRPIIKTEAPKQERPQTETENPRIKEQRTSRSKWEKFGMSRFMENIREFFDEESDD
jgi:cell division protein FtsA